MPGESSRAKQMEGWAIKAEIPKLIMGKEKGETIHIRKQKKGDVKYSGRSLYILVEGGKRDAGNTR